MNAIDEKIEQVAKNLARLERQNPEYQLTVAGGFTVPIWLTYVSAAQRMIDEQSALTKLKD